ncbi:MAG: hypothetical protein ACYTF1_00480 [Planctomycetota bacterium]|jgi:hypothetical protein
MYRLLAVGVFLMWVGAMSALFVRDVWPAWTAQDPPPMTAEQFAHLDHQQQQFALLDAKGHRLGTSWSRVASSGPITTIYGTIVLDGLALLPDRVKIETSTEFDDQGGLDSFDLNVMGVPGTQIYVRGERRGIYFPCQLKFGTINLQRNLELSASRMIGQSLRPFNFMPTLKVGQSWRMQILDPVSAVIGKRTNFTSVVARVTGTETIEHLGRQVECLVVKTYPTRARAWVDKQGRVLVQEADIPLLGKVVVREEDFDQQAWQDVKHGR